MTGSLNPRSEEVKNLPISTHTEGIEEYTEDSGPSVPTTLVVYTPAPYSTPTTFIPVEDETLYWDPTTHVLPLEPTMLATAAIPSPTFSNLKANDYASGSLSNYNSNLAILVSIGMSILT